MGFYMSCVCPHLYWTDSPHSLDACHFTAWHRVNIYKVGQSGLWVCLAYSGQQLPVRQDHLKLLEVHTQLTGNSLVNIPGPISPLSIQAQHFISRHGWAKDPHHIFAGKTHLQNQLLTRPQIANIALAGLQLWNVALSTSDLSRSYSTAITSKKLWVEPPCRHKRAWKSCIQRWNVALPIRISSASYSRPLTSQKHCAVHPCRFHPYRRCRKCQPFVTGCYIEGLETKWKSHLGLSHLEMGTTAHLGDRNCWGKVSWYLTVQWWSTISNYISVIMSSLPCLLSKQVCISHTFGDHVVSYNLSQLHPRVESGPNEAASLFLRKTAVVLVLARRPVQLWAKRSFSTTR